MMRHLFPLILILICSASCSTLPEITPDKPDIEIIKTCTSPFLKEKYRLVHSIHAEIPGRGSASLLGVVVIDPSNEKIDAALMTIEGLVIYSAHYDKMITINRALPPFDSYNFAEGMIDDIKQIFLNPKGRPASAGLNKNREDVCRYKNNNITTDIVYNKNNGWTLNQYNDKFKVIRTIHYSNEKISGLHKKITLKLLKKNGYKLLLELIKGEKLSRGH